MTRIEVTSEDLSSDAAVWRTWQAAFGRAASAASALPGMTTERDWSLLGSARAARTSLNRALGELTAFFQDGATACDTVATALTASSRSYSDAEADVVAAAPEG